MNDIRLSLKEVDQDLLVHFLDEARDVAKEVVKERVLHQADGCMQDGCTHLYIDIFTAQAEVELAHGHCANLLESGIKNAIDTCIYKTHLTVLLASNIALAETDSLSAVIL